MILDIFSELQKPDGMPEPQLYAEAVEQAKLADEMGYGCWWSVEHHGTGHFSYCSTPDLMLTLISQHTQQIHLGHSGVLAPFNIHHLMQMAPLPHETVMKSIRTAGKVLVPELAAFDRSGAPG